MFTDSHAHLDFDSYDVDRDDMLARAGAAGVTKILNISLGPETEKWEKSVNQWLEQLQARAQKAKQS